MGLAAKIPGWERIRLTALNRDGWRCRECGKAGRLEVHHVIPLKDGGTNDENNVKTLCVGCHLDAHRKPTPASVQEWDAMVAEL